MDLADLADSPILGFGSRATYRIFLTVDEPIIDRVTRQIRRLFRNDLATVRSWRGVEDRLGRNLTLAENYLSLVGFAIVVLGGIGVWSVTRVFVHQRIKSVAILKCLGASSSLVRHVLVQMGSLAAGAPIGVAGRRRPRAIPTRLLTPLNLTAAHMTWSAAGQGIAVSVLVSIHSPCCRSWICGASSRSCCCGRRRPHRAAGATGPELAWRSRWARAGAGGHLASRFCARACVCAGLAGRPGISARATCSCVSRARWPIAPICVRHAVISFGRPGGQARVVLLAVGLGCFFIMSMRSLQANLLAEFTGRSGNAPDLV